MKYKNILGLIGCTVIFFGGFAIHSNIWLYFNVSGLLIVVGGTFGATLISYRMDRLKIAFQVLWSSYRTEVQKPEDIVGILVDLSVKSRFKGILSLEEEEKTAILFLRRALGCLVDGLKRDQIREILNTEMYFFKMRREDCERVLRTMSDLFPSFGLVGSVVGLIGMLAGVGDTSIILKTIPIALTSTLYGIIFSNFFFVPFAANLRERTDQELLLQKIITEGVIAIESEVDPRVLERKLKSFLTPSLRRGRLVSLKRIQARFGIKPENF
ncbi:MAG: MotA/TolQ/ExbB proton channel family protein, partial [Proteobacteria bacterium]|nr:MotA/TolQ/ExbB proton channel family protein [Pseudomonadota bacterium]MBU1709566.1 MotA/TolQ/ExbB proton channel family protein [Pseudomonadota bacterium]